MIDLNGRPASGARKRRGAFCASPFLRIFIRQDLFLFLYIIPINDKIVLGGIAMRRNDVGAILVIAVLYAGMQLVGITCPSSLKYPVGYLTVWFQVIL